MAQLRVTNRNNFTLKDRFDGIDYTFEPNVPVVIEEIAARHIFGYGLADKLPSLVRQGWCLSSDRMGDAVEKLNNFMFESGEMQFTSAPEPELEEVTVEEEIAPTVADKVKKLAAKVQNAQVSA